MIPSVSATAGWLPPWEPFAWTAIGVFLLAVVWRWRGSIGAERVLSSIGWLALAVVWVAMLPYYALEAVSPIQTILLLVAIPASVWAGLLRWRGRSQLFIFSKVAAVAGILYLPAYTIEPVRRWLIETVAAQTHALMGLVGYQPGLAAGPEAGYLSMFAFDAHTTYIVLACTGIGSISIFGGAILAVGGPIGRRIGATILIAAIIYGLNLIRNVFVGLATPLGWFAGEPFATIAGLFGIEAYRTSYFVSHTLISQPISVVVLIALALLAVRLVPELFTLLDEIVFVLTGEDVDLRAEIGPRLVGDPETVAPELAD